MHEIVAADDGSHTVGSALRLFSGDLARAGIADAGGDVRRLMEGALDATASSILACPERLLSAEQFDTLHAFVARRARREPVSRILGVRHFYGRPFAISPATFDPRPESETLVSVALDLVHREGLSRRPLRILDLGTGSGCLLVTLLCELPEARGVGSDVSAAALEVARANARSFGVADRAQWLAADGLENVPGIFHLLVANPPYVRTSEIADLELEVRAFDPITALDGGADGLAVYRRVAPRIPRAVPAGWFLCEVGLDQAAEIAALLAASSRTAQISTHRDLAGRQRCVAMKTRG
jgi:release factor glutamine methyltransferase